MQAESEDLPLKPSASSSYYSDSYQRTQPQVSAEETQEDRGLIHRIATANKAYASYEKKAYQGEVEAKDLLFEAEAKRDRRKVELFREFLDMEETGSREGVGQVEVGFEPPFGRFPMTEREKKAYEEARGRMIPPKKGGGQRGGAHFGEPRRRELLLGVCHECNEPERSW